MRKFQTFQEFLSTQSIQVEPVGFIINLLLAALLAYLLSKMYVRFGTSLSNRNMFARNFILLSTTTMLIITIVKSSLALSLGLVGALSIVRFRAAIKEPEELSYLFLAIAIGLGFGADQRLLTLMAFVIIAALILVRKLTSKSMERQNLHLTVAGTAASAEVDLDQVVDVLNHNCRAASLRRFDESREAFEAAFLVEFDNFNQLNQTRDALKKLSNSLKITFLDNKGVI